jgi:hypothetical protein
MSGYVDRPGPDPWHPALPLSDFWAIRLTTGGDGEMLYPSGGTYWAFAAPASWGCRSGPCITATFPIR